MLNLLFGVPVFQSVYAPAFERFQEMAFHAGHALKDRAHITVKVHARQALVAAMNTYGQNVLDHDFDGLIVADDDCLPPMDAIPRLVAHLEAGRDFVSTVGYMRGYPHTTTIGQYLKEGRSLIQTPYGPEWRGFRWLDNLHNAPPLLKTDFCGVPIAIISRRCFEKAERPWFGTEMEDGGCTHDVFWADRLQKAGIDVLVDTTIRCGHLADPAVIDEGSRAVARHVAHQMLAQGQAA